MGWLPDNFTRLTYLGGTGSQYIDTNIHLDNESIVKSTWMFYNDAACIYGCFTSSADTDNFCLYGGSHANDAYIRFGGQLVRKFRPNSGSTYSFEHGADGFFVDGERITEFSPATFTCSAALRIFGLPNSKYAPISGRCYNFQVLKKTESSKKPELLHDFVPVRRNDDDVLGLYDMVESVFYTNNGSGTFIAGEDVIETPTNILSSFRRKLMAAISVNPITPIVLPSGYTKYDWIQGDGTAYIQTNALTVDGMALELDLVFPATSKNNSSFFGVTQQQAGNNGRINIIGWGIFAGRFGFANHNGSTDCYARMKVTAQARDGQAIMIAYRRGVPFSTTTDTRTNANRTFGYPLQVCNNPDARIYRAKAYADFDMQTLILDCIPCTDPNGVPGMYDLVSETFFSNAAGSGVLTVGFD